MGLELMTFFQYFGHDRKINKAKLLIPSTIAFNAQSKVKLIYIYI